MEVEDDSDSSYWGSCPAEILIIIFKYLDAKDLLACMSVNTTWRANADYWGNKSGKWFQLLENGVANKGLNFLQRSKLNFRELYMNCRMWYSVPTAQVKLKHVYDLKGLRNINVYKDNLIAITQKSVKFFNLESGTMIKEIDEACLDYRETDFLVAKFTRKGSHNHVLLRSKYNGETYESLGFRLCHVQHNKCHLTNSKNAVEFFECTPEKFMLNKLGRYYSSPKLLSALHMYDNDMYIYTSKGDVYQRRSGELGIKRVCSLAVPSPPGFFEIPSEMFITMFHKCSVIYSVYIKDEESIVKNLDIYGREHLVLFYLNITCAVQHDDILLLGFSDGKVGIVIVKHLWTTNNLTPAFQFYIHEVAGVKEVEAVNSLEVYEADGCHHVFVATDSNLYQVIISHADYEKVMH